MTTATSIDSAEANELAEAAAQIAYKQRRARRRGISVIWIEGTGDIGRICYFDSRPDVRKLGRIRQRVTEAGIEVLAESHWPRNGRNAGHSAALLFDRRGDDREAMQTLKTVLANLWTPSTET